VGGDVDGGLRRRRGGAKPRTVALGRKSAADEELEPPARPRGGGSRLGTERRKEATEIAPLLAGQTGIARDAALSPWPRERRGKRRKEGLRKKVCHPHRRPAET